MMISGKNYPMKGGICEKRNYYIFSVNLPGFERENISTDIENGFLIISASTKGEENKSVETYQRRFYIGHSVTEADIKSSYKRNVLKVFIPKNLNHKSKSMAFA